MPEAPTNQPSSTEPSLRVPMPDVVRFVRQLSHDLRNHLNAAELQSAYINEVAEDAELKGEVKRLRGMLSEMGASLQRLTTSLAEVKLTEMPYEAAAFVEDLQQKIRTQFAEQSAAIDWDVKLGSEVLEMDPQMLQVAMVELFANAFQHERGDGRLQVAVEIIGNDFTFLLREPKSAFGSTEDWGRKPFHKVKHGQYALGLPRARSIIEAHRGQLSAAYDASSANLITTVVLPTGGPA